MSKCSIHDEAFGEIKRRLLSIEDKMDEIIKLRKDFEYLKEDLLEHKSNGIIHISQWYIIATVIGSTLVALLNLGGCYW
jgi:hypothetical protein